MKKEASEITKRNFEEALLSLYEEMPLRDISISLLCKKAGYHRSTFYVYYQDIIDLLHEIDQSILSPLWPNLLTLLTSDDLNIGFPQEVVSYFTGSQYAYKVMMQNDLHFRKKLMDVLTEHFNLGGNALSEYYRNVYTIYAIYGLILHWTSRDCDLPIKEFLSLIKEIDTSYVEKQTGRSSEP